MRRIFIFAMLALMGLGGVAAADHPRWRGDHRSGGVYVQRSYPRQAYRQSYRHQYRPRYPSRVIVRPDVRVVRRPIYVQRPRIAYRYYNYYQRPAVIAENYAPMTGYYWVPGQWQWSGYEWIWQPGHYEPDPAYNSYNYAPGYYPQPY